MKLHTLTRGAALAGAVTLAHASVALAAGSTGSENTPLHLSGGATPHASSSSSGIVRTIVGLFIVIAVIYGVAWVLRQARKGKHGRASGRGLEQVASLPLGSNRSVALVRAGQEFVLLGVAEHSVTPIRTYTEEEALALGLELPAEPDDDSGSGSGSGFGSGLTLRARRPRRPAPRPRLGMLDTLRQMTVRS